MLEILAIAVDMSALYIAPTIFLLLCPGIYWNEIHLTSVPIQVFLQTRFGVDVSLSNLRIFLILMHNNFAISIIFHSIILLFLLPLAVGAYYILYHKLL